LKHSVEKTIKSLNVSVFLMKARQAMSIKMKAAKMKARFQKEVPLHGGACGVGVVGDGIASLTRPS
jgi:hypothetical protein